jgi:ribosomal-protein-alanine N-acetyltransferase
MLELVTERLRLRRFQQGDLIDTFAWTGDPEVSRYTFWSVHKTLTDTQQFLDFCFKEYSEKGIGPWAVELKATSVVIGNCSYGAIHRSDARVELAFFFARQWWGQGLATEGLRRKSRQRQPAGNSPRKRMNRGRRIAFLHGDDPRES